jgi:sec-independent protein translocase protein TatA
MNTLAFIPGMQGHGEIIVIVLIVLLLFGSKKLPELARSIGKSLGEFKRGQKEGIQAMEGVLKEDGTAGKKEPAAGGGSPEDHKPQA